MEDLIIVGIHPVKEAISEKKVIDKVLIQRGLSNDELSELKKHFSDSGVQIQQVPKIKLDKLSKINHQGILAFISPIVYASIDDIIENAESKNEPPLILVLDGVTDTRNFGAICRSAECMGAHGIVIPNIGSARITEATIKSSAGAVFKIPIAKSDHLLDAVNHFKASEIEVISCTEKAEEDGGLSSETNAQSLGA